MLPSTNENFRHCIECDIPIVCAGWSACFNHGYGWGFDRVTFPPPLGFDQSEMTEIYWRTRVLITLPVLILLARWLFT